MNRTDLHRHGQGASGTISSDDREVPAGQTGDSTASAVTSEHPGETRTGPRAGQAQAGRRGLAGHPVLTHLIILIGYLAAGIALTWPRASYLAGKLPATRDAGSYVWGFWWVTHQVEHLSNPWFTRAIAAPGGAQLGMHALMPLPSVLMIPVTLLFGPSASYNLLCTVLPGLMCYAMYRAARLWLPSQTGAIAAGAFFGLSTMLTWRDWYHLNLAAGVLFLPIVLEAAVQLRRRPGWRRALILGLVLGAALLTDQEMAVLVYLLAGLVMLEWLLRPPRLRLATLWPAVLALAVGIVVSIPQILAVLAESKTGTNEILSRSLAASYVISGVKLGEQFMPSARVNELGMHGLGYGGPTGDGVPTFGLILTLVAVFGLIVAWRMRGARLLALLWLGCAVLSLGGVLKIGTSGEYTPLAFWYHGVRMSAVMPFTWFVRLPGLSSFREANRVLMLGIVPASLLAGAGVGWLRKHAPLAIIVVAALALLEAGWGGTPRMGVMPTALPAVDKPIAADHSSSLVVDVPYGLRGGTGLDGAPFDPDAQVLATADGHPRAVAFISRVPPETVAAASKHPFLADLVAIQHGRKLSKAQLAAARQDARTLHIGWVLAWPWSGGQDKAELRYLQKTGFRLDYRADKVDVYRPAELLGQQQKT